MKAVFSLASKIAPSVVFVDEVRLMDIRLYFGQLSVMYFFSWGGVFLVCHRPHKASQLLLSVARP